MADAWLEPYEERILEFPLSGSVEEQFRTALGFAIRAPSIHNTQPWRCRIVEGRLEVHADETRRLEVADPHGRSMIMSVGAFIEYLHVVLSRFGVETSIEAGRGIPSLMAVVSLGACQRVDATERKLFLAIPKRSTNRRPFRPRSIPEMVLSRVSRRVAHRRARLGVLRTGAERMALIDLVAEADLRQMADPAFRRELAAWHSGMISGRHDGIPARSAKGPRVARPVIPVLVKAFDVGRGVAAFDRRLALNSAALAILWTPGDDQAAWLAAGRALARALLTLASDGVSASFLNQPVEVPEIRQTLDATFGRGHRSQIVLRLGYGDAVDPTARRPVESILEG